MKDEKFDLLMKDMMSGKIILGYEDPQKPDKEKPAPLDDEQAMELINCLAIKKDIPQEHVKALVGKLFLLKGARNTAKTNSSYPNSTKVRYTLSRLEVRTALKKLGVTGGNNLSRLKRFKIIIEIIAQVKTLPD